MLPTEIEFLSEVTVGDVVWWGIVVAFILGFLKKGLPRLRQFGRMMDTWFGDPRSKNPEDWGVLKRLETLEQLKNNGGGSVKDKVDKMYDSLQRVENEQTKTSVSLEQHLVTSNAFWANNILERDNLQRQIDQILRNYYGPAARHREVSERVQPEPSEVHSKATEEGLGKHSTVRGDGSSSRD